MIGKPEEAKRTPSPPCILLVKGPFSNGLGLLELLLLLHDGISETQKSHEGCSRCVFMFEGWPRWSKGDRYNLKIFSIETLLILCLKYTMDWLKGHNTTKHNHQVKQHFYDKAILSEKPDIQITDCLYYSLQDDEAYHS